MDNKRPFSVHFARPHPHPLYAVAVLLYIYFSYIRKIFILIIWNCLCARPHEDSGGKAVTMDGKSRDSCNPYRRIRHIHICACVCSYARGCIHPTHPFSSRNIHLNTTIAYIPLCRERHYAHFGFGSSPRSCVRHNFCTAQPVIKKCKGFEQGSFQVFLLVCPDLLVQSLVFYAIAELLASHRAYNLVYASFQDAL